MEPFNALESSCCDNDHCHRHIIHVAFDDFCVISVAAKDDVAGNWLFDFRSWVRGWQLICGLNDWTFLEVCGERFKFMKQRMKSIDRFAFAWIRQYTGLISSTRSHHLATAHRSVSDADVGGMQSTFVSRLPQTSIRKKLHTNRSWPRPLQDPYTSCYSATEANTVAHGPLSGCVQCTHQIAGSVSLRTNHLFLS